jgi:copper chaperone CopZ
MTTTVAESQRAKAMSIFSLFNLGCSSCSAIIEHKLVKLDGIENVTVNPVTDTVLVEYDPRRVTAEEVRTFLRKLGYDAGVRR